MPTQSISAKLGEIHYRAKIVNQQLGKSNIFPNEPASDDFRKLLREKLKETEKTFRKLQKRNIKLSPYLEIGSEHCLRPALLESKFGARGFATDISLYSLMEAPRFARIFKFKKTPQTICADAYHLPFKSNTFPFVFLYETLHHFPNPAPVLTEAHRVLAPGGTLLIGAEPVKQELQIQFWRRPTKLRFWEKILKYTLILPFISHIGKTEVEHGILEEAFSLAVWERSLSIFDKVQAEFRAFPFGPTQRLIKNSNKKWLRLSLPTKLALWLFGGGLNAYCFKKNGQLSKVISNNLDEILICPNCLKKNEGEEILTKTAKFFICRKCKSSYGKHNGILMLLENSLRKLILKNLKV